VWLLWLQNWGKELVKWLGDRVEPVVVDDTKADKVKKSLQVMSYDFRCWWSQWRRAAHSYNTNVHAGQHAQHVSCRVQAGATKGSAVLQLVSDGHPTFKWLPPLHSSTGSQV
jgi:hypothetical protein